MSVQSLNTNDAQGLKTNRVQHLPANHPRRVPRPTNPTLARVDDAAEHVLVECGDVAVYWRRFGSGTPLVLLHGGHGSWMHWVKNIEALAARHTVLVPDMPGFGGSNDWPADHADAGVAKPRLEHDAGMAQTRLETIADCLSANIDALVGSSTEIGLVAFSYGALPAGFVAVRRKGVSRLAFMGPGGHGVPHRPRPELVKWRYDDAVARRNALRYNLEVFMLHNASVVDELAVDIHEYSCMNTRFRSRDHSVSAGLFRTLQDYTEPALFVWGEHDLTATPDVAAKRMTAGKSNRAARIIANAGHWVQFEAPEAVNSALLDWFERGAASQRI